MLILTRRIGEVLVVGDGDTRAEVMVLGINGNQVKVGVAADPSVPVHRLEIYNRILEERKEAENERL